MADVLQTNNIDTLAKRIVRYKDLIPCFDAFIDTRTPGSDKKENFTIIGPGVSENPNQHIHIAEPHGFNIGGARQPPKCTNSQHSHETAEVFYVHSGQWRFDLGVEGEDAQTILSPGDLISIPTHVFRGFTNTGKETGFLWAILGGDDPGRVLWAPDVFAMAKDYGLVLLEDGSLIDTGKGETIPAGKAPMPTTSAEQAAALQIFDHARLESCVARSGQDGPKGSFSSVTGVQERILIGNGRMDWPHGFQASEIELAIGSAIPTHHLDTADVWFVQSGQADVLIGDEIMRLGIGDTITFPRNIARNVKNVGDETTCLVAVRGGDQTANIQWA